MSLIPSTPKYPATRRKGEGGPGFRARPCAPPSPPPPALLLSLTLVGCRPVSVAPQRPSLAGGSARGRGPSPLSVGSHRLSFRIPCRASLEVWHETRGLGPRGGCHSTVPPIDAPHEGGAPPSHDLAARPSVPVGAPGPDSSVSPVHGGLGASRGWFRDVKQIPFSKSFSARPLFYPRPHLLESSRFPHTPIGGTTRVLSPPSTGTIPHIHPFPPPPPPPSRSQWAPCVRVTAPSDPLPHRLTALPYFHAMRLSSHPSAAQSLSTPPLPPLSTHHTAPGTPSHQRVFIV